MTIVRAENSVTALRLMTLELIAQMNQKGDLPFFLALSGGGTAMQMWAVWVEEYALKICWKNLRFFWVDERCVAPADEESNFGQAQKRLFEPFAIPETQIFRIRGEENPELEAVRYSRLVEENVPLRDGKPVFDCIILGVGEDLHTASIFPSTKELLSDTRSYAVSRHPVTGQCRITMTGTLLLHAAALLVPVVGKGKKAVVEALLREKDPQQMRPAAYVLSRGEQVFLYAEK